MRLKILILVCSFFCSQLTPLEEVQMLLTSENMAALELGFNDTFLEAYEMAPEGDWGEFAMQTMSDDEKTGYPLKAVVPRLKKSGPERKINNLAAQMYELENDEYDFTVGVKAKHIKNDKLAGYVFEFQGIGHAAKMWKYDMAVNAVKAGKTALCFDGKPYFHGNHPVDVANKSKGEFSNLNTEKALNDANYESVRAEMIGTKGPDGQPMGVIPNILMVPPQLESAAKKIVESATLANGAGNPNYGTAKVVMVPELASEPAVWYLLDARGVMKPIIVQVNTEPEFWGLDDDSDHVKLKKEYVWGADADGAGGYTLPHLMTRNEA